MILVSRALRQPEVTLRDWVTVLGRPRVVAAITEREKTMSAKRNNYGIETFV